jgi:hypothetical protein
MMRLSDVVLYSNQGRRSPYHHLWRAIAMGRHWTQVVAAGACKLAHFFAHSSTRAWTQDGKVAVENIA